MDSIPYDSKRLFYELQYMDICRKHLSSMFESARVEEERELDLDYVRETGVEKFRSEELFALCSKTIRENNYAGDDFLTYLCYELFRDGEYDKVLLTYLAKYYCGATLDMKKLWSVAKEYEVHTHELSERILTQMLYSEDLFGEVAIFEDYYAEGAYFRLQQAYLVYVSREYVVEERKIQKSIIDVICREYDKGEDTADICKIAVLKYYATRSYDEMVRKILKSFLQQLCGRQIYFPFFLNYEEDWLKELQLWDKTMIEYHGQPGSRVILYYQLQTGTGGEMEYSTEVVMPMYDNIYVKKFVLYANETLKYYFKETIDGNTYRSEKETCSKMTESGMSGRYGRLNDIMECPEEKRLRSMQNYAAEDKMAQEFFVQY